MRYPSALDEFDEIVFGDTEFHAPDGWLPRPICAVFYEMRKRRLTRVWLWEEDPAPVFPPITWTDHTLFIAYVATAELGCFHVLGWPLPAFVLDLNVEVRNLTNGALPTTFISLVDAAKLYHIPYLDKERKEAMRGIAIEGGLRVAEHRQALLNYCTDDTLVMIPLLEKLLPTLSLPQALIRGDYVRASAGIEYRGIPVNVPVYDLILRHREPLKRRVAQDLNAQLGPLYEGAVFKQPAFVELVRRWGALAHWPRTRTGKLSRKGDVLERMAGTYPEAEVVRQAQHTLEDLDQVAFAIGPDRRNRYMPGLWGTVTGRNSPKSKLAILLRSRWWRHLFKPPPGRALAYLDFSSEEFLVAAVLAQDAQGIADYVAGDVYLTWGQYAGLIPADGTKVTHARERNLLKTAVLAMNYGAGVHTLAYRLGVNEAVARRLRQSFRERYPAMVRFGEQTILEGVRRGGLRTRLGWRVQIGDVIDSKRDVEDRGKSANQFTPQAIRNWPVQSGASEILHLTVIEAAARGLRVVGTLHDAILIEAPVSRIDAHVQAMIEAMQDASVTYLQGPRLRVDAKIVRYPEHYRDPEAEARWEQVRKLVWELSGEDIEALSDG
jgi:DNA polymerase I